VGKAADAKAAQDWESSPPSCRTCDHFLNGGAYRIADPVWRKRPHKCALGGFNTQPYSVCQKWTHKGEVLAK
jgi:hypothetical protein